MFLAGPVELEINSDGKCAGSLHSTELSSHQGRGDDGVVAAVVAMWRKLTSYIAHNTAAQRRNREAVERDLFGGQYTLSSKNDDDLPMVL